MGSKDRIPAVGFNVPEDQSLRKSIQRLRWFKSTFEEQVDAASVRTGITYRLNSQILTECFLAWLRQFEASKPKDPNHRYAYVGFAAGKMLKQLLIKKPLEVVELPKSADPELPEYFWPEGFVYVSYCLNVRQSVLRQDFDANQEESSKLSDVRTWWSFKENVNEMPDYAISFLDLFAGQEPNWASPGMFNSSIPNDLIGTPSQGRIPT